MHRTYSSFSMLQAIAVIAGLAILLWSLGLPSFRTAEAASLTQFSDTLSDSAPSQPSNHTIVFTTPTGNAAGEDIVITFPDGASDFDLSTIGAEDIDLSSSTGDYSLQNGAAAGETWGVSTSSFAITLSSGSAVLDANATVTIEIGANATFGGGTQSQIINPTAGSYEIDVTVGDAVDSGTTRVAIIDSVTVSASVDTTFDFTVRGSAAGQDVNGTTTTGSSSPTAIQFGQLEAGIASTAAQNLDVVTNARNGFVVTVQVDRQLTSATGADIDCFNEGVCATSPTDFVLPTPTVGQENTYGHWGLTSEDDSVGVGLADDFGVSQYVAASTTPVEVMRHDGPADGETAHSGTTQVGYTVAISSLQEAADDYSAEITYVATPVF